MRTIFKLSILLFCIFQIHDLLGQGDKRPLTFSDVREWRTNSVTLSDDGLWYTKSYSLFDEPDPKRDTLAQKEAEKYFGEENQTDVLYICSVSDGMKYQVPDGSSPAFSSASDWIAYRIDTESDDEEETKIELKHLESGFTVEYESSASYRFLEDKNFFVTSDKSSLLIYDLENRREHYIGNIGEYLIDKSSDLIAYTISSEDKRGNGIYLYDPARMITRSLESGNFNYSQLSWSKDKASLAAFKYETEDGEIDETTISVLIIRGIGSDGIEVIEYPFEEIEGLAENMGFTVEKGLGDITWSNSGDRLFVKIKDYSEKETGADSLINDDSSVQVWHWKDKKLLSERIMEYDDEDNEVFDAVFFPDSKKLIQLTDKSMQNILYPEGTDTWAIGRDNREYISDWDVTKNDLYRVNLNTGERNLIEEKYASFYSSGLEFSPDGEEIIMWDGKDYWLYEFASDSKRNITEGLDISFVDEDYDLFGFSPDYGILGWVKDQNSVLVQHKYDLWLLPTEGGNTLTNLTGSLSTRDSIRYRLEDYSFAYEEEIEDRYIDLSERNFLYGFDPKTKESGYFNLQNNSLTELIYGAQSYSAPYRGASITKSEDSEAIVFLKGDFEYYPEAHLSNSAFENPRKITDTNPQQEQFKWGNRILLDYQNDDGVPLQGVLSIPDGYEAGDKLPMIVYSYEKLSDSRYNYTIPYLNGATVPEMLYVSEGYLFLRPDIHFNVGTPHSDMHECIDAAIEKVIELGYVDADRIGYEGFSFGGHCGMYMSTQENKFAAIAAGAGVSNLVQGFNLDIVRDGSNEQDYYMTGQGRLGTDPTSNTEMYISESPVFNAATMDTPLLLFHGTADKVVQWEHSYGFYSILRYLQKPVVFLSYRGEGHGLRKEGNRLDIQNRLKEYFDHHLKGAEAKQWMTEGLPYIPSDDEDERMLPKWK